MLSEQGSTMIERFNIAGFREVILSVRDLGQSINFYKKVSAWEIIYEGECSRAQLDFWDLPNTCTAVEAILANPGEISGYLRLVSFKNVKQIHIRSSAQSWDSGGIYDIDIRTVDIESSFEEFQAHGWTAYNDPMEYEFGKFHISEVLMHGNEDIVIALIQRYKPKLEGYPNLKKLSRVFNSSQVVADMEVAKDFYINTLGFKIYMEQNLEGTTKDQNLFGVPQNIYEKIKRKICIVSPVGKNEGSVELIQLEGISGKNYASLAKPPNLGLLALRFPTKGLNNLVEHLKSKQENIIQNRNIVIPPYGHCQCLSIQSPDGAWLEFYEQIES